jgi:hypothetical protein
MSIIIFNVIFILFNWLYICITDDDLKGYNDEIEKLLQPDYSASRPKRPGYKRHSGNKKQQSTDTQQHVRGAHPPATHTSTSTPANTSSSKTADKITSYVPISVLHPSATPTADPESSVTTNPPVDSDSSDDKKPAVNKIRKDPKVHDLQAHSESQVARTSHRRFPRHEEASHSCISVPDIVKPAFGMSADRGSHSGGSSQSTGCLKVTTACTNLPFQERKAESDLDVGSHTPGEFQVKTHIAGRETIGDILQKPESIIHSELKRKLGTNSPQSDAYSESLTLQQSPVLGMPASPRNTPESLCEAAEVSPMNRMVTGYEGEKPWTPVLSRAASSSSGSSIERGSSPCKGKYMTYPCIFTHTFGINNTIGPTALFILIFRFK